MKIAMSCHARCFRSHKACNPQKDGDLRETRAEREPCSEHSHLLSLTVIHMHSEGFGGRHLSHVFGFKICH